MDILAITLINNNCWLNLWETKETYEELFKKTYLTKDEKEKLNTISHPNRRKEFLSIRRSLQTILGKEATIGYEASGKPHLLKSDYQISISHKHHYTAIVLGLKVRVAVDIEHISNRIERLERKFVSPKEAQQLSQKNKARELTLIWCAKECLHKLIGSYVSFKNEMYIDLPKQKKDYFYATFVSKPAIKIKLFYQNINKNYLMVWTLVKA